MTDHGKADTAALEEYMGVGETEAQTDDTALDAIEQRLVSIVRRTLDVPCTPEDNFFALGGGSLDALDVLARVRAEFGVRVRLRDFFRAGTIRELRHLIGDVG
ncbi:acyl carrier protein [Streptomyces sp. AC627_RSS907]|uniref:acyl carrier protein n=1 Tax=Streptomyces sp. AC627_RSS907 TaxID=2823684 RepID=UPI001C264754|nr:acyl carrier protein [Streptomyces sp. AC627_RSS907]